MILPTHIAFVITASLLLFLIYLLRWRDYRLIQRWDNKIARGKYRPGISIVIPAHNQALQLEDNLMSYLEQNYEKFEVIVVDIHSSDNTADVIKRHENQHVPLRCVKLPATSRYIGKNRLAMSLGIRAAHFPWVLFTYPDCRPQGNFWLKAMAESMSEDRNIVIGYANYEYKKNSSVRRAIYERLRLVFRNLRGLKRGKALNADIRNIAIRKSFYMEKHPLSGKLAVPFGEASILADMYGLKSQTAFASSNDATIIQQPPHRRTLASLRMYNAEVSRHKSMRSRFYDLREGLASLLIYLFVSLFFLYATMRIFETLSSQEYDLNILFYDVPLFFLGIISIILPLLLLRDTCRFLNIRSFGMRPLWYDIAQPFRNLCSKIQRWHHRKEFVRPIIPSAE